MDDATRRRLRKELSAYHRADSCRLAALILDMPAPAGYIWRGSVVSEWTTRYGNHRWQPSKSVRTRITEALPSLRLAGMVRVGEGNSEQIYVLSRELLQMAADNLAIVVNATGMPLRATEWSRRPRVPDHLREIQMLLEEAVS